MEEPIKSEVTKFINVYSPSTLLGVYANALHTNADGRIILAKGIYQTTQNNKEYGGYFYDTIKSPNDNKSIKAKVPSLLRSTLDDNSIYVFKGFIEKRINFSSIELIFVVDEVHSKEENNISEEEFKRFDLIQNKISKGFRDLEAIVKESIYNGNTLKIANLYGSTAIVHKDFEKGLGESKTKFQISDFRCNFVSKSELVSTINKVRNLDFDVIAFVRGGGEKASLNVFNDPGLGKEIIEVDQILVTALGHTVDNTLLDKIADRKFALPHDYGNSLKVWVEEAAEEQAKSKSLFIDQVKKDLTKTFHDQISTLQKQLNVKNKEFENAQKKFKEMLEQSNKEKLETIQAKEKALQAGIKSLTEQLKTKDDSIKTIKENNADTTKKQISSAVSEYKTRCEIINADREKLIKKVDNASQTSNKLILFVIIAAIIGLIIGLIF